MGVKRPTAQRLVAMATVSLRGRIGGCKATCHPTVQSFPRETRTVEAVDEAASNTSASSKTARPVDVSVAVVTGCRKRGVAAHRALSRSKRTATRFVHERSEVGRTELDAYP
jgi:hypothetical protein